MILNIFIVKININADKCSGSAAIAREKIMSILQHVSNVHAFPSFKHFKKCEHGTLDGEIAWIAPGLYF